jgi:hypothetical protein
MIDPTPDYNSDQPERRELDLALVSLLESIRWGTNPATLQQQMTRVQAAMDDLGMATETYCTDPEPIHGWFSLSYASWLVLPRVVLQAMPVAWQRKLVGLLRELDETFDWEPKGGTFIVRFCDELGRVRSMPPGLSDYRRGKVEHLRRKPAEGGGESSS